jgi:hypothetical protein
MQLVIEFYFTLGSSEKGILCRIFIMAIKTGIRMRYIVIRGAGAFIDSAMAGFTAQIEFIVDMVGKGH